MCDNIHSFKNDLLFEAKDFYKYSTIYNEERDVHKRMLIFGAVKMEKQCIERILRIVSQFGQSIECLILMLD